MYPNVQGSQVFLPRSRILARLVLSIWPGLHMQHRKFADIRWLFREDVLPDDNARPNNIFLPELGSNYFSAFLKRLLYQFRPTLLLGGPRLHGARGWCRMIRILRQAMTRLRNKNHIIWHALTPNYPGMTSRVISNIFDPIRWSS